ncbi:MAG TPA: twin transmembrane helix small protein [Alphaproteobacteria bacterium]|jgi:amino acid transporter
MSGIFFVLSGCAALAVVVSLFVGVGAMAKGGETSKKYSNKMMRARVIMQGLAVLFFILGILSAGG